MGVGPRTGKVRWSDNHFRLYGLEPQSAQVTVGFVLERVHETDRERVARAVAELDLEGGLDGLEYRIVRADGAIRHFRVTVSVVERDGSLPNRIVGSVTDMTERRAAERAIAARIAVSSVLDGWISLDRSGPLLVGGLGEAMGLAFGALMVRAESELAARIVWQSSDLLYDLVGIAPVELTLAIGGSDAGRA